MDQGFAPQGFSATDAATIERQLAARAPHGSHIPRPTATETAGKGAISASSKARSPHLDPTQQNVARLEGVKSAFMMPAQMEFFGMLGGGALGWVTNKFGWQRATAALGMLFKAPVQALRQSSLAEFFHVPANFLKAAATEASTAGGKAQGWAESATRQAKTLEKTAKQLDGRAASVLEPIGKSVGSSVGWFERTPVGKSLHSMFDSLMHGRKAAAIAKHEAVFAKAQGAFTTEASAGWRASAGNFFSRIFKGTQPVTVPAGELSSMMHGLSAAKGDHAKLKAFAGNLETLIADGALSAEAKARAGNVAKHVGKLVGSAHAMETYGSAAGGSMKTMVKAMGKAIGRVPVFNALLAVGITAGVGATMLAAKAESKEAKLAFDDLSDQLRSSDSGFLDAVKKVQKSQGMWGVAKTGMKLTGVVADGAMWMLPGGGGMAMMGAVMLPQLCESLVPGNPTLGAYVALQKNERGELKLDTEAQTQAIRQLVGVMPAVAAQGGFYNRLAQPIAAEIVSRKMNTQQVIQLLGDNAAFTALSSEVAAKRAQAATAEAKAKVANDNPEAPLHPAAVKAAGAMSAAEAAYHQAAKPANLVAANDVHLAGKMNETHRHVG